MKYPVEAVKSWVKAINDEARGLSAWEVQFMESVTEQLDRSGSVSDKQEEVIERIYVNKVR